MKNNGVCCFNYYPQEDKALQLVIVGSEDKKKNVSINNLLVHHTSPDVWKFKIISKLSSSDGFYMASREDGNCLVTVRFVNENVLDEIKEGMIVEAQVVGIALAIDIFKNEQDYKKSVPKSKNGEKYFLSDGVIIPTNLIVNNSTTKSEKERNEIDHSVDHVLDFKGTIISANKYSLNLGEIQMNNYYSARVSTEWGLLNIIIPLPILPKDIDGFGKDNVIVGKIILSCDLGINDYEKYIENRNNKN